MTTATATADKRRRYTPEERNEALAVFAACESRADLTERALAELGLGHVRIGTLHNWAYQRYSDDYQRIRAEIETQTRSRRTDRYAAFADTALDVAHEGIAQVRESLAEGRIGPKELPRAVNEMVGAAAKATEEAETLAGKREAPSPVSFTVLMQEIAAVPGVLVHGLEDQAPPSPAPALPPPATTEGA